uniref:Uncharacterized protein n=1 Tax=Arundo donax TaxID=35708 RepID=A0A0A9FED2_ARUDO
MADTNTDDTWMDEARRCRPERWGKVVPGKGRRRALESGALTAAQTPGGRAQRASSNLVAPSPSSLPPI